MLCKVYSLKDIHSKDKQVYLLPIHNVSEYAVYIALPNIEPFLDGKELIVLILSHTCPYVTGSVKTVLICTFNFTTLKTCNSVSELAVGIQV